MTALTITPNWKNKTARFKGTIAAGEHVAVSIANDDNYITDATNLRLRVVNPANGKTLAQFPMPEEILPTVALEGEEETEGTGETEATTDEWDSDLTPLSCTINLNTAQMLKAVPPAANVPLLFVLDAYKEASDGEPGEFTLYFKDMCEVTHWPRRTGEEQPVNLDDYKDIIADFREDIYGEGGFEDRVESAESVAQSAAESARLAEEHAGNSESGAEAAMGAAQASAMQAGMSERAALDAKNRAEESASLATASAIAKMRERTGDRLWHNVALSKNNRDQWVMDVDQEPGDDDGTFDAEVKALGTTAPRSLASRFADVVNVKDFGAVGNGLHNDLAAIQRAFDAAAAIGGKVVFPTATYFVDYHGVDYACLIIKNGIREIDFQGSKILFRVDRASQWQSACFWMNRTALGSRNFAVVDGIRVETRDGKLNAPSDGTSDITIRNVSIENVNYDDDVTENGQAMRTAGQMWRAFVCMDSDAHDIRFENVQIKSNSRAVMRDGKLLGGCNLIYLTGRNISLSGLRIDCAPEPVELDGEVWGIRDTVAVQFGWVDNLTVSDFHIVSGDCCLDFHYSTDKLVDGESVPSRDINISNGVMTSKEHSALAFGCWTDNKTTQAEYRNISTQRVVVDSVSFDRCCGCLAVSDGRADTLDFVPCKDFLFTGCMFSADSTVKPNSFYGLVSVFHNLAYNWADASFGARPIIEGLEFDGCRFVDYRMANDSENFRARPSIYVQSAKDVCFYGCTFDLRETRFDSYYYPATRHGTRNAAMVFFDGERVVLDNCEVHTPTDRHLLIVDGIDEIEVMGCVFRLSAEKASKLAAVVLIQHFQVQDDEYTGGADDVLLADNIVCGREKYIDENNEDANGVLFSRVLFWAAQQFNSFIERGNVNKNMSAFVNKALDVSKVSHLVIDNVEED